MNSSALTFPLPYFCQQEVQVPVTVDSTGALQSVNLTGFRAGEVKSIFLWLQQTDAGQNTPGSGAYAPLNWVQINNVTLTYNGEVFSRFDQGSSQLWNLVSDQKGSAYNNITQTVGSVAAVPGPSYWTECPFAQVMLPSERESKLVHGKPILNAVVNLTFNAPAVINPTVFTLHAMYLYNASLLCSRGSAEYIF